MYPYLLPEILGFTMPMYDLLILIGIFIMLVYIVNRLEKKEGLNKNEIQKIVIFLAISLVFSLIFSFLLDGIFHSIKEGEWSFGSVNFLGALIGGFASFLLLMKFFYKDGLKDIKKIANTVIAGVVIAHAIGRIGCFCAGCCYGIPTDSYLGVIFPHGHAHNAFPDVALYPTQLIEAFFLFGLFILLNQYRKFFNKDVEVYLIGYGIFRILIEFIRGDERGVLLPLFSTNYNIFPTPAQLISVFMVLFGIYWFRKTSMKIKHPVVA
jgi:phosphatidylglycerol:prolipoprotein diacylglycerol transferase